MKYTGREQPSCLIQVWRTWDQCHALCCFGTFAHVGAAMHPRQYSWVTTSYTCISKEVVNISTTHPRINYLQRDVLRRGTWHQKKSNKVRPVIAKVMKEKPQPSLKRESTYFSQFVRIIRQVILGGTSIFSWRDGK